MQKFEFNNPAKPIRVNPQIEWKLRHDADTGRHYIVKYHVFKRST